MIHRTSILLLAILVACAKEQANRGDSAAGALATDSVSARAPRPDSSRTPAPSKPVESLVVSATTLGSLRVGMTAAEAEAAMPGFKAGATSAGSSCVYATAPGLPKGLTVMIDSGKIVRFDVTSNHVATSDGAHVGDTESQVQQLYGDRVKVTPHKYEPRGHYLTATTPGDTRHQTIFETKNGRVISYRAGQLPQVAYLEGCG